MVSERDRGELSPLSQVGVLSVMMPEAGQSVLSCDQQCGTTTRLLNSLGTALPLIRSFITSKYYQTERRRAGALQTVGLPSALKGLAYEIDIVIVF